LPVVFAVTVILIGGWFFSSPFYWKKKGVPSVKPWPFIGNAFKMLKLETHEFINDLYNKFPNERFFGFYLFSRPVLVLRDPSLVVQIMGEKEDYFLDKGFQPQPREVLSHGVSDVKKREHWRYLNMRVSPYFAPDVLDDSVICTVYCLQSLIKRLNEKVAYGGAIDVFDLFSRYTIDLFMVTLLGVDTDVHKRIDSQFMSMKEEMLGKLYKLKYYFNMISPKLYAFFNCCLVPTYIVLYVKRLVGKIRGHREEKESKREDFIQGMFNSMKAESKSFSRFEKFSDVTPHPECNELFMTAQLLSLYPGGTEVLGIVLTMCIYEIARKASLQDQIKVEVYRAVKAEGPDVNQRLLNRLVTVGRVIDEALRLYPPYVALFRECTKPYKIPGSEVTLDVGTLVCIPVYSLHRDPRFHKYSTFFEPERFKKPMVPGTYLPFGMGSRKCMCINFAYYQLKTSIFNLVTSYSFRVHGNFKLELSTSRFFLQPKSTVDLVIFPLIYNNKRDSKKKTSENKTEQKPRKL